MLFWVATQVLRACKVSTTPPKSKIIVTKVAPRSFLLPVCCRHDTGWVATDFGICCNCCLVNIASGGTILILSLTDRTDCTDFLLVQRALARSEKSVRSV